MFCQTSKKFYIRHIWHGRTRHTQQVILDPLPLVVLGFLALLFALIVYFRYLCTRTRSRNLHISGGVITHVYALMNWKCLQCTFSNVPNATKCEICQTPRPTRMCVCVCVCVCMLLLCFPRMFTYVCLCVCVCCCVCCCVCVVCVLIRVSTSCYWVVELRVLHTNQHRRLFVSDHTCRYYYYHYHSLISDRTFSITDYTIHRTWAITIIIIHITISPFNHNAVRMYVMTLVAQRAKNPDHPRP